MDGLKYLAIGLFSLSIDNGSPAEWLSLWKSSFPKISEPILQVVRLCTLWGLVTHSQIRTCLPKRRSHALYILLPNNFKCVSQPSFQLQESVPPMPLQCPVSNLGEKALGIWIDIHINRHPQDVREVLSGKNTSGSDVKMQKKWHLDLCLIWWMSWPLKCSWKSVQICV